MYQASLAMRISVSFSRLLLNWVATYRHNMRAIIPDSSSVRYARLNDDTVRLALTEKMTYLCLSGHSVYRQLTDLFSSFTNSSLYRFFFFLLEHFKGAICNTTYS